MKVNDGSRFMLEANTKNKYNIYQGYSCPNDSGKFLTALETLIKTAQMDKEIHLIWSNATIIQDVELAPVTEPKSKSSKSKHK